MNYNKNHWYDGWLYDKLIAPNQDKLFTKIKAVIEPNSSILDVGCGTGRFSFFVSDKAGKVVGMDLSLKNIRKAKQNLSKNPNNKIAFHHTILANLISQKLHFNYAVTTYVLHEVDYDKRVPLLNEMAEIADKIIIGDYLVPKPGGIRSIFNDIIEFGAGREHYRNYKTFVENGGVTNLAGDANLKIQFEIKNEPPSSHIVILIR